MQLNKPVNPISPNDINPNIPAQDPPPPSRFDILVNSHQIPPKVAKQLYTVLSTCTIVLLCDDSGSMATAIAEEGKNVSKTSTRWMELKKLAACLIEYCTAINPDGLDIHFFNRPSLLNVKTQEGLSQAFMNGPSGGTPLCGTLKKIFTNYAYNIGDKQLLVVVITDGQPSDGSRRDLFNTLVNKPSNVHVSFAECTDEEEDMAYLDEWDGKIPNFDNTDDYREELIRVKQAQGQNFKFDYNDYVVKILLATFVRWYFNLDQQTFNNCCACNLI